MRKKVENKQEYIFITVDLSEIREELVTALDLLLNKMNMDFYTQMSDPAYKDCYRKLNLDIDTTSSSDFKKVYLTTLKQTVINELYNLTLHVRFRDKNVSVDALTQEFHTEIQNAVKHAIFDEQYGYQKIVEKYLTGESTRCYNKAISDIFNNRYI